MKELSRKVFLTILGMLTFILVISLVILNIVSYRREYENVKRNLDLMDNRGGGLRVINLQALTREGSFREMNQKISLMIFQMTFQR